MTAFEAIVDSSTIGDWIETYRCIVDEARVYIREDGLYAVPVDPANVAMVEQTLHASAFESYEATEFRTGVNLETLQDYVEAGDDDLVNIAFNEQRRMLEITSGSVDLEMACIDPDSIRNDGDIPQDAIDDTTTDIRVEAGAFEHAVDVVGMVSDHVTLDAEPDREPPLQVTGRGDTDSATIGFEKSLQDGSEVNEEAEAIYSLDYLEDMTKPIPSDADLRVRTGHEWPMVLDYEYAGGSVDCRMMLAPRIKSE